MSLIIAIVFSILLWVGFAHIIEMLKNEAIEQFKATFKKENAFKEMFDGIQEGIIVLKNEKLHFIN